MEPITLGAKLSLPKALDSREFLANVDGIVFC